MVRWIPEMFVHKRPMRKFYETTYESRNDNQDENHTRAAYNYLQIRHLPNAEQLREPERNRNESRDGATGSPDYKQEGKEVKEKRNTEFAGKS